MRRTKVTMAAAALVSLGLWSAAARAEKPPKMEIQRTTAQIYETKAEIARARGDYGAALDWYRAALTGDRNNPALYNGLGIVELKLGDTESARWAFERALKIDGKDANTLNNLGAVYCLEQRYKPAVKYLKKALALNEPVAATHVNLAEAWMGQRKLDRAMTEYARALELDPDILDSATNEGMVAQISTPEQRALISFLIARAYARRGNVDQALEYLQRAKELHYAELANVYAEPEFAGLWKDPRLTAIVKPRVD
ncbi:MAG: tetratricopeptide repeat protein [Acidobacteriaceae bacterium]|jgi:tetratricopeptide (TPR) repeat protein